MSGKNMKRYESRDEGCDLSLIVDGKGDWLLLGIDSDGERELLDSGELAWQHLLGPCHFAVSEVNDEFDIHLHQEDADEIRALNPRK